MYWLMDNLTHNDEILAKFSFHRLTHLGENQIKKLIEKEIIRVVITPPIEVMPELADYVTILNEAGYESLGDIHAAYSDHLVPLLERSLEEIIALQDRVETFIRPDTGLDSCC